jgi:hypothetical protein
VSGGGGLDGFLIGESGLHGVQNAGADAVGDAAERASGAS